MADPNIITGDNVFGKGGPIMVGANSLAKVGFYGTAPIVQRAASTQATSVFSGISTGAVSTNSLVLATLLEVCSTLTALGLWKGSA